MVAFISEPLRIDEGIPVFSNVDNYTENYQNISVDHLSSVAQSGVNPFIEESLWLELENSTRSLFKELPVNLNNLVALDVGVGTGRLLQPLSLKTKYGIDISTPYLKIAESKGFKCCFSKVEDMPFVDNSFDLITCTDVLEHVFDLNASLKQIERVLKPSGYLVIRVPYKEDISPYLDDGYPYEYAHLRSFDMPNILALFTRIFNFKYISHNFSAPYYKANNSTISSLSADSNLFRFLHHVNDPQHPLFFLKSFGISDEELTSNIYSLRDNNPAMFRLIEPYISNPLEVSVLFSVSK